MFQVTTVNFAPETKRAALEIGERRLGMLTREELIELLELFQTVDAIENVEADPELRVKIHRKEYSVTTAVGRLRLTDPRNTFEPSLILEPVELVAELDGSAAAARREKLATMNLAAELQRTAAPEATEPASPPRWRRRTALGLATLGLGSFLAYSSFSGEQSSPRPAFELVSDPTQAGAYRQDLAGVFMTGSRPGDHGITLTGDGAMTLFQLNPQSAPSLIRDDFQIGRIDGQIAVLGRQTSVPIRQISRDILSFGGETFKRIQ